MIKFETLVEQLNNKTFEDTSLAIEGESDQIQTHSLLSAMITFGQLEELEIWGEILEKNQNYIIKLLQTTTKLKTLHLHLESNAAIILMKAVREGLKQNNHVVSLSVNSTTIMAQEMKIITEILTQSKTLRSFSLNSRGILDDDFDTTPINLNVFAKILKSNTTLTSLELIGSKLYLEEHDVPEFHANLSANKTLQSLSLPRCELPDKAIRIISKALENHPVLCSLDLGGLKLGTGKLIPIIENLNKLPKLTKLSLYDNKMGATDIKALTENLIDKNKLVELDLSNNDFGKGELEPLIDSLKINRSLTSLGIGNTNLPPKSLNALALALTHNKTLTKLNVKDLDLKPELSALAIAIILKHNVVVDLPLSRTRPSPQGVAIIAKALLENSSLRVLDLSFNHLKFSEFQFIMEIMRGNKTIEELHFHCDYYSEKFSLDNFKLIAEMLKCNTNLTLLRLEDTNLCSESLKIIIDALKKNTSIRALNFSSNEMCQDGEIQASQMIMALLTENQNIVEFDILKCGFTVECQNDINLFLKQRKIQKRKDSLFLLMKELMLHYSFFPALSDLVASYLESNDIIINALRCQVEKMLPELRHMGLDVIEATQDLAKESKRKTESKAIKESEIIQRLNALSLDFAGDFDLTEEHLTMARAFENGGRGEDKGAAEERQLIFSKTAGVSGNEDAVIEAAKKLKGEKRKHSDPILEERCQIDKCDAGYNLAF